MDAQTGVALQAMDPAMAATPQAVTDGTAAMQMAAMAGAMPGFAGLDAAQAAQLQQAQQAQLAQLAQAMQLAQLQAAASAQALLGLQGACGGLAAMPQLAVPAAQPQPSGDGKVNIQCNGMPLTWTEDEISKFFSEYGEVASAKALPVQPGKSTLSGVVRMSLSEATWCVNNLSGNAEIAQTKGLPGAVTVNFVDDMGREIPRRTVGSSGPEVPLQTCEVEESDNLYVKGLPGECTDDLLAQIFSQYGTVTQTKVLAPKPLADKSMLKVSGFVRMSSVEEATRIIAQLNGQIPNGLRGRVTIGFAGDGVPLVHKLARKLAEGETLHQGVIRSYNLERRNGFITCDEVYQASNCEVYAHHNVLDRAHAGPGDHCIFIVYWKNEKPQAALPLLRIASCATPANQARYALKGWYRGISDPELETGEVDSADLKTVFGKDTLVPAELAKEVNPGWVCFNAKVEKTIAADGSTTFTPIVIAMESCEEAWKPEPADLSKSYEIAPAPGKGFCCKGKGKMLLGGLKGGLLEEGGFAGVAPMSAMTAESASVFPAKGMFKGCGLAAGPSPVAADFTEFPMGGQGGKLGPCGNHMSFQGKGGPGNAFWNESAGGEWFDDGWSVGGLKGGGKFPMDNGMMGKGKSFKGCMDKGYDKGKGYMDMGKGKGYMDKGYYDKGKGYMDMGKGKGHMDKGYYDKGKGYMDMGKGKGYMDKGMGKGCWGKSDGKDSGAPVTVWGKQPQDGGLGGENGSIETEGSPEKKPRLE